MNRFGVTTIIYFINKKEHINYVGFILCHALLMFKIITLMGYSSHNYAVIVNRTHCGY